MENQNGGAAPKALMTATIASNDEAINRFTASRTHDAGQFIFENPDGVKFAVAFDHMKIAAVITQLAARLIGAWHNEHQGLLFQQAASEARVSTTNEIRGHVAVQFEMGIAYVITTETALSLADILLKTALSVATPEEIHKHNQKKAPMIVAPRKAPLILPPGTPR